MDNTLYQKDKEFYQFLTTMHVFCILILMLSLLINENMLINQNIFPVMNVRLYALTSLLGILIVFLYYLGITRLDKSKQLFTGINFSYITLPLVIAVIILFFMEDRLFSIEIMFIIPVLIASSVMGKTAGFIISTVCGAILLINRIYVIKDSIYTALETQLVVILTLYIVGWYVGTLANLEAAQRRHLSSNLEALKEEALKRERVEQQQKALLDGIPDIAWLKDREGRFIAVNRSFEQACGVSTEELEGKDDRYIWPGELAEKYMEDDKFVIQSGSTIKVEEIIEDHSGQRTMYETIKVPIIGDNHEVVGTAGIARDITERIKAEERMAHMDRLNLVGEMAASIGHEIRNPMTTIRGFLQLLGEKKECEKHKEYYDLMIEELDRANSIITEFLSLSKNRAVNLKLQNLNTVIAHIFPLIQAAAVRKDIIISTNFGSIPDLLLDEKEIRQLILNLVRNGIEAMSPNAELSIKTYTADEKIVLAVVDQGKGIPADALEKVGTPFFTTKEDGTGLGLAVCYSIAARHNAVIKVESSPRGTTVFVQFKSPK